MPKFDWDSIQAQQEIIDFLDDVDEYGADQTSSSDKARSALNMLYASDYGYDEWKNIGISFKAAGGELGDWLSWCSIDAQNYDEKLARGIFENTSVDGKITEKTLYKHAWRAGWEWRDRKPKNQAQNVKMIPSKLEFDNRDDMAISQLESMFEPYEMVNIVTKATRSKKGKLIPNGYGKTYVCSELVDSIRAHGLEVALGGYNHDAGVWLRVNPTNGGITDKDVSRFGNALIESDDMPLKDQERMLFELGLPIISVTNSGGKSLHAVIKVDADGPNHFADRVNEIHRICEKSGMSIDRANRNPSRLTRLAGVERGENTQSLIHLSIGARSFDDWIRQDRSSTASFDYGIEPMDMQTPIVKDEEVISGIMRRGDKMCVAGASKSYKSFALIELAIAVATGSDWFGWECKQGRVLYINCELRGESFRQRVWDVADKLEANRHDISMNMDVWNMRGRTQPLDTSKEHIIVQAENNGYDMVILDPIYKLFAGDENSAQEVSAFMLLIDELAMRLHSSIVYCHHHSKGAKGGLHAQDRFSGSGVFARDVDELVDISPLDIGDAQISDFGWDGNATAWRVETVLRDFPAKRPVDIVFQYPIHYLDEEGDLEEFRITSPQLEGSRKGGRTRGNQISEKHTENIESLESYLWEIVKSGTERVLAKEIAPIFGVNQKTIKNWALASEKLRVEIIKNKAFISFI